MANLNLVLIPANPILQADFKAELNTINLELYDENLLNVGVELNSLTPTFTYDFSASTAWHPAGDGSYATIPPQDISTLTNQYPSGIETIDLRVVLKKGGTDVVFNQILAFNIRGVNNNDPNAYIVVPIGGNSVSDLFRQDGKAPAFDKLESHVAEVIKENDPVITTIAQAISTIKDRNLEECLFIARELAWNQGAAFPSEPDRPLKKILDYDFLSGPGDDEKDKWKEKRQSFFNELHSFYDGPEGKAQQLTQYIWALVCAKWAEEESAQVKKILFRLPTVTPDTTPRELIIKNLSAGHVRIDAQYFYAIGIELPSAVTREARYEQFISSEQQILLDSFAKAEENRIVSWSATGQTEKQVVRLARAQHVNRPELPVFDAASSTEVDPLIGYWSHFGGDNSLDFWNDLSLATPIYLTIPEQAIAKEGHSDLIIYLLVQGDSTLYGAIEALTTGNEINIGYTGPIEATPPAAWAAIYTTYITTDALNENVTFLPAGTIAEKADYFAIHALNFFNQTLVSTPADLSVPAPNPIPCFVTDANPISQLGIDFDNPPTQLDIDAAIANLFSTDACAQEWLQEKVAMLVTLHKLTLGINPTAMRQMVMETLFALGITHPDQVGAMSEKDFKACLVDTVLADRNGNLSPLGQTIWDQFGADPQPHNPGEFVPVNPGNMVDCRPPQYATKLGQFAYLQDLLAMKIAGQSVSDLLNDGYNGLSFDELMVSAANAEIAIPHQDLSSQLLAGVICSGSNGAIQEQVSGSQAASGMPYIGNTISSLTLMGHELTGQALQQVVGSLPPRFLTADQDCAYEKLASSVSGTCGLPYHLNRDISETYLQRLGGNRFELSRKFSQNIHAFPFAPAVVPDEFRTHLYRLPVRHEQALEYLGISDEEYDLVYSGVPNFDPANSNPNQPDLWSLFGFSDYVEFMENIPRLPVLLKKLCLDCCEFEQLLHTKWIEMIVADQSQDHSFSGCQDCEIDQYFVGFPNTTNEQAMLSLWKLFLISRLHQQLKHKGIACYSFADLTLLISDIHWIGDDPTALDFNPHFLEQFVAMDMLRTVFGICPIFERDGEKKSLSSLLKGPHIHPDWEAALNHFVNGIIDHCAAGKTPDACRPPDFRKLLLSQIDLAAYLAGFRADAAPEQRWYHQFSNIIRFAEQLYHICNAPFSLGQLQFMLSADEQLAGDDPAPQQTRNEAQEYPFDLPDNEADFSLDRLREKLLAINLSDEETASWNWTKIDAHLRADFGFSDFLGMDLLFELGAHFFPGLLGSLGYSITNEQKQFRVGLSGTSALMWNTGAVTPFRYDPANGGELFTSIPLPTAHILTKLQEVRQLTDELSTNEQEAVQKLIYAPVRLLAPFAFLFRDFNEAKRVLIETTDEQQRWAYFQRAFAHFHRSCAVIAEHLTEQIGAQLGMKDLDAQLTWKLMSRLYAGDNPALGNWEEDTGESPALRWDYPWQAGAFAALSGLQGTGIKVEYRDLTSDALIWREFRGSMEAFSPRQNSDDSPVVGLIPAIDYNHPTQLSIANIRNGFAFRTPDGALLGGVQGWVAQAKGLLYVEETGMYQFRAGAPTPAGEIPDFAQVRHCKWKLQLKRGSKVFPVLDHAWDNPATPGDCSVEMRLKRGMYEIEWFFQQPQPGFTNLQEDCPQPTGWALKWTTPAKDGWQVIPTQNLYHDCPVGDLSEGLTLPAEVSESLAWQYHPSVRGIRRSFLRAISAGLLFHGSGISAKPTSDSGHAEIDYLLTHPEKFAGLSYYHDGTQWQPHLANLDINFLPVRDNYCLLGTENDQRLSPSPQRIQAFFDWFERLWEIRQLKLEAASHGLNSVWHLWHECAEQHQWNAVQLHLKNHLGVREDWFATVTHFYEDLTLDCRHLEQEEWTIRVWEAVKCIRKWQCTLANLAFDALQATPSKWLAVGFDHDGLEGKQNLIEFVAHALVLNSTPPRYDELKKINDVIRERESAALLAYVKTAHQDLKMLQLLGCSSAGCRSLSRVDFSIQLVQAYLQRIRLKIEMVGSWKPSGIITFLETLLSNGNYALLSDYLHLIQLYFLSITIESEINTCFNKLVHVLIDAVFNNIDNSISEILTGISPLMASSEEALFGELIITLQTMSTNDIALQLASCIQTIEDANSADVQAAIDELKPLTEFPSANPIAIGFSAMVQEPVAGTNGQVQFTEKERLVWENRLSTYAKWHSCQLQHCYPEDYMVHKILAEDRKSRAFNFLEEQLNQQVLTQPVSGGTSQISFQPQPSLGHLLPLQQRQASVINATVGHWTPNELPQTNTKNHHTGRPDLPIREDWRTLPMDGQLTFWLETAKRLGKAYIRIAAAGVPAAELRMHCKDVSCCPDCGHKNHVPVVEYYFWLLDSTFFPAVRQKCEDWMAGHQLAELLHMQEQGKVYLAWAEVNRGRLQQMGWSSEGITVTGTPQLVLEGRYLDSLYLVVENGETALQPTTLHGTTIYDSSVIKPGFRFDLATGSAVILPQLAETLPAEEMSFLFAYHDVGAPLLPKRPEGTSLLVSEQLQNHCRFAAAKDWLDVSWNPLAGSNEWHQYDIDGEVIHEIDEESARKRVLLFAQLENLHQWIKRLHHTNTQESIAQAGQLLCLAEQIMGQRPKTIAIPFSDDVNVADFSPLHPGLNRRLLCLYDAFADQRALLDHCLNAHRVACYALQPSVATSSCLPAPCCTPLEMCIPNSPYRFQTLLNYAKEYAGQLSALGDALLGAFEKGEQETLALLREGQAKQIADLSLQIKKNLAIEADWQVQALEKTLEITRTRLMYYQDLINVGLISEEQDNLSLLDQSMILQAASQVIRISSQPPNYIPTPYLGPFPLTEALGGKAIAKWLEAGSDVARIAGGIQSTRASKKGILGSFVRRQKEWEHQVEILTLEVKQLKIQILAANRRLDNARHDLDNHQLQLEHAEANLRFLRQKFTGEELYHWQRRELAQLYHQMYECALQLAYQAQINANIEQGYTQQNWLDGQYWDNYHEGLLAGHKLSMSLRKMEQDFMNQNHRRYELSKSISLAREFPRAFLQLRYSDSCAVALPEELFAKDYPSHYCQMIRSVALTIACVVGPYTTINSTLRLLGSKVRISPRLASTTGHCSSTHSADGYSMQEQDNRFVIVPAGDQAMATSRGLSDSGYHQFDFRDERKLIFEHAGVAAQFCIEMPEDANRFDKRTISDVILEINYTAKEGGSVLGQAAKAHVKDYLPGNGELLMCLDEVRPDDWYQFQNHLNHRLALHIGRQDFAYIPGAHQLFVDRLELFVETVPCPTCDSIDIYFQEPEDSDCIDCDDTLIRCVQWQQSAGLFHGVLPHHFIVKDKPERIGSLKFPEGLEIKSVFLLLTYGCKWLNCQPHDSKACNCNS